MDWERWLHLLAIVAMAAGAWRAWKAMPKPVELAGRKYYPLPGGGFRTVWGRPVKDPAIVAALDRAAASKAAQAVPRS